MDDEVGRGGVDRERLERHPAGDDRARAGAARGEDRVDGRAVGNGADDEQPQPRVARGYRPGNRRETLLRGDEAERRDDHVLRAVAEARAQARRGAGRDRHGLDGHRHDGDARAGHLAADRVDEERVVDRDGA